MQPARQGEKKICIFSNNFTGVGEGLPCHSTWHWRLNRCAPVTVTQSSDDSDKSDNINIYLQTANVRAPASDHNLHQFLLLDNCSSSDKSSPLHSLQAANIATLVVVIFPDSWNFTASSKNSGQSWAVREWMEPGRPGARAGVMCVVMLSGECGGGEAGHNWGRHFIMWTQTSGGAGWPIWWADTRPSAHQEMLDTFQENNQQSQLLVWHSVKCSSSSSF